MQSFNGTNRRLSGCDTIPKFKVILLGEAGVGKSALFLRLKDGVFGEHLHPTLGIESCSKTVSVEEENVVFQVWDTAGVEKYRTLTRNYYRNAHATFLVYSLDNPASLHYLSKWVQDCKESAPNALMFLIGNKADLEWNIPKTTIEDFAAAHDFDSAFVTSAKTGEGIEPALKAIGHKLLEFYSVPTRQDSFLNSSIYVHTKKSYNYSNDCLC